MAGLQFLHCHGHGTETAGTGCIDNTVGAPQIEAVGDSSGNHIAQ